LLLLPRNERAHSQPCFSKAVSYRVSFWRDGRRDSGTLEVLYLSPSWQAPLVDSNARKEVAITCGVVDKGQGKQELETLRG